VFTSMALLAKKLSFLPLTGLKAVRPFMATYVSASPAVLMRRNNANRSAVVNDEDTPSSVEDEGANMLMNEDEEAAFEGDDDMDDFLPSVQCRVMSPTRRPWATSEDETAVRFRMDMPGVAKENVKVYLDDMKLVVRGKYSQLKGEVLDEDHILADNVGTFTAEVMLPANVQEEKIKSEMKDGMLLVTAPKEVRLIPVD